MTEELSAKLAKSIANTGFAAFQSREYRYFWVAAAFSNIGMWALVYGRLWLMHQLTDSPLMVGLVTTATLGPVLLFSLFGGVLADRVNRLSLLRITRTAVAILTILTGILIATDVIQPWHLITISIAIGVLLAFDIPSRSAMLPSLVPKSHLASAIALYSFVFGSAAIIGPMFFAPLVSLWGIEGVFFVIGTTYILTVLALSRMNATYHKPTSLSTAMFRDLIDGMRYTIHHRVIAIVILLGMIIGVFGSPFETLLPTYADKIITGGIDTYSRLLLSDGIGGLIATATIATLGSKVHPPKFLVMAGIGFGLGLLALSNLNGLLAATLAIGFVGAFHVTFRTMSTTLVQSLASNEFRGRVMSIYMLTHGATALGGLQMGLVGQYFGVSMALLIGGLVVIGAIALAVISTFHRFITTNNNTQSIPVN